ncbi:TetR family transcriptional regulator [Paenibacillus pasadenensis]|uniref:TetR family transcriptional regulator n=1 Tax=Paenibacillus pasadenensis TaxID=217090 RepID=UPI00203FA028|nr:TetR family transcriptional regulator [Paenibacillus pasadenensis]MCM3748197.1 TetR family transcriptional regulator [Paenibacillus pasadenensis]
MALDKKQRIIDASIAVFQELGIEKAKISDIVKAAGIAQGTFYLYFPSKLSLMPAIAEIMAQKIVVRLNETPENGPVKEQLVGIIDAIFEVTEMHKDLTALLYSGITQTEHVREWETIYDPIYSWINDRLERFKEQGSIRDSVRTVYASRLVLGLIETSAEQNYLYASTDSQSVQEYKEELKLFLFAALGVE